MCEEPKKISFGFSKVSKKSNLTLLKKVTEIKNDIQFIECLEEKSIKLVGGEEKKQELPIIPMLNGNLLKESIIEVIKSREQEKSVQNCQNNTSKQNFNEDKKPLSLDEQAANEILEDLNKKNQNKKEEHNRTVLIASKATKQDKESTLEDYENMPIENFGLAMLRGMGWCPQKGIGLNERVVTPIAPALRPKGMGLGADKVPSTKNITCNGELLIMKKGATVKIVSGPYNNLYGKIEGFDELPGRLMIKIAESGVIVSLNEIMVQLVSSSEYNKNVEVSSHQLLRKERHNQPQHSQTFENPGVIKKGMNSPSFNESGDSEMNFTTRKARKDSRMSCEASDMEEQDYNNKKKKNAKRYDSGSSSSDEFDSIYKNARSQDLEKHSNSRYRDHYKEKISSQKRCHRSSEKTRKSKKSSNRDKYEDLPSDSRKKEYLDSKRRRRKTKRSESPDSSITSHSLKKKYSKHYKR
ncbi:G-patch domain and KOW motifs-containing protein-like [Rhodnius prolixus]|uniref:G-patch domain and KOW motifs-containing protein-like n=1 Tax=Rhodnius prolixus TaxID=13249 RepID=UPI003D18D6BB